MEFLKKNLSNSDEDKKPTRREFIIGGLAVGSMLAMSSFVDPGHDQEEMIKAIDAQGKIYYIHPKDIPPMCSGKVSNKRLEEWMKKSKK